MKRLITLCMICFSLVVDASVPFHHMVIFGDSLSDNGNSYERTQHFVPQTPPYFQGRFSDGPVWAELLAQTLSPDASFLQDYALGGAGVTAEDEDIDGLFTLGNQVKDYLNQSNQVVREDDLFVIWIGANNYLILPDDEKETVETVKLGTANALDKLLAAGAKNFIVINLPELSKTPFAQSLSEEDFDKISRYTLKHNQMLDKLIADYQKEYPDVHWKLYDIHTMFNKVLVSPESYGFSNVSDTCFEEDLSASLKMRPVIRMEKLYNIEPPSGCEDYLFFDPVHPTAKAHRIMAMEILNDLADIFNPETVS